MQFSLFTHYLSRIDAVSGRLESTQILAELFSLLSPDEAHFVSYFLIGELYPPYENKPHNIADKQCLRALARLAHCTPAHALEASLEHEDIGQYCAVVLAQENRESSELSLLQIRDLLVEMLELSGSGSQDGRETKLVSLLSLCSPLEGLYLIRFLIGTLRLGCSEMTLLDAYSWMLVGNKSLKPDIEHAYNISADIGTLAQILRREGVAGLDTIALMPGIPVRPAAAERLKTSEAMIEKLGTCASQPKLDGFRLQVHVWKTPDGEIRHRFFSRNLHDMSEMFPEFVTYFARLPFTSLILEGEAIAYNRETGEELPFQETTKRRRKHGVDDAADSLPLRLYLFDLLYINDESCLSKPHTERRSLLLAALGPHQTENILVIEETICSTPHELAGAFDAAMSLGYEGIVAKRLDAIYRPGKRDFNWIKLKRQETGSVSDTIDCVILGYYFGRGRRSHFGIGALLVGIYNPRTDMYETIAKIGTGLTDEQWREARAKCDARRSEHKPHEILCDTLLTPDVWVVPTDVCMIRADDITRSPVHTAGATSESLGYALRFPRLIDYRSDKSPIDTTSPDEIARLYELQDLKTR